MPVHQTMPALERVHRAQQPVAIRTDTQHFLCVSSPDVGAPFEIARRASLKRARRLVAAQGVFATVEHEIGHRAGFNVCQRLPSQFELPYRIAQATIEIKYRPIFVWIADNAAAGNAALRGPVDVAGTQAILRCAQPVDTLFQSISQPMDLFEELPQIFRYRYSSRSGSHLPLLTWANGSPAGRPSSADRAPSRRRGERQTAGRRCRRDR